MSFSRTPLQMAGDFFKEYALYFVFVILLAVIITQDSTFLNITNLSNILTQSSVRMIIALGVAGVIVTRGTDLSVGRQVGLAAVVAATMLQAVDNVNKVFPEMGVMPIPVVILLVCAIGALIGLLNGIIVAILNVTPFIATLGMQFVSLGLCAVIAQVQTQTYPSLVSPDGWFKKVLYKANSLPVGIIWLAAFFALAWFILKRTKLGRYTYAIGSNEEAVELSGVMVSTWKFWVYVLNGFFCGLAGIIYAATFSSITPQTGNGQEMYAIAACVIGGTSLAGGIGSLWGTILGVFVICVLKTGLLSMQLPVQWQQVLIGVVVLLAVLMDVIRTRRAKKV